MDQLPVEPYFVPIILLPSHCPAVAKAIPHKIICYVNLEHRRAIES
jgi:hypothetical protein